jgi:GT2 family glycosyltransferase
VYNRPDEVDELLESLSQTTYQNDFEIVIVEDSPNGLKAAYNSTKNVIRVKNSSEVNKTNILNQINFFEKMVPNFL